VVDIVSPFEGIVLKVFLTVFFGESNIVLLVVMYGQTVPNCPL
jgi:hypothetical protein